MKPDDDEYKKLIRLLKESQPVLSNLQDIEREVIRKVSSQLSLKSRISAVIDFLFAWSYIGWIRKSLVTASLALIFIFIYQQAMILKRVDFLSRQIIEIDRKDLSARPLDVNRLLTNYRNSPLMLLKGNMTFTEQQIKELFDTINQLQIKYKDLENIIEGDPELKKIIEKKIFENSRTNNKL